MDELICQTKRALWHIFEQLDNGNTGKVQVSKLKVITSSIGHKLGHNKAEEILNRDGATTMDFGEFFGIIAEELFDKIEQPTHEEEDTSASHTHSHSHINKKPTLQEITNGLVKTCWTFCSFESARTNKAAGMTIENCMTLWKLFNFLSECDEGRQPVVPIRMHPDEVSRLLREFMEYTGQRNKEDVVKQFSDEHLNSDGVKYTELLNLFEKDFVNSLSRNDTTRGLNHLHELYILNVLHRGTMYKRGYKVKNWKDRLFVLTTVSLKYYKDTEKVLKGEIVFDSESSVELLPDRPSHKPNRFVIHTTKKPYEISAPDVKTKNEWVSAIQEALKCVGGNPDVQKEAVFERCLARINKKRQLEDDERLRKEEAERQRKQQEELDEEKRKRLEDEELLKARQNELDEERKRRAEMEDKLLEEQRLREEDEKRLRELEEIKRLLERLLEEERQAKKDEEIVRNLQARLLEEEFQKREELERLKQQQEEMLRAEREQNAVLAGDKRDQERSLQEAKERLEQLERERAAAAEKMQEASEKLQKAEKDRHIMEERVKLFKTKTSVGLNRPVQPRIDPMVTHRGQGAFCPGDFRKRGDKEDPETESQKGTEADHKGAVQKDDNSNTNDTELIKNEDVELKSSPETGDIESSHAPNHTSTKPGDEELSVTDEAEAKQNKTNENKTSVEPDNGEENTRPDNEPCNNDEPQDNTQITDTNTDVKCIEDVQNGQQDKKEDNEYENIQTVIDKNENNEIVKIESEENESNEVKIKTGNNNQGFAPFTNGTGSEIDFKIDLDTYN